MILESGPDLKCGNRLFILGVWIFFLQSFLFFQSPSSPHSSLHLHTIMNMEKYRSRLRFPQIVERQCLPPPQLPLLFVTVRTNSTTEGDAIHLYSLTDNRIYKLPAPYLCYPSYCNSYSNGWMILESGDGVDHLLVSLKDDDNNNNECIRLPMEQYPQQYIECVFFSTPDDPDGVFFVREEEIDGLALYSDRFFLYRRSEQVFHAHRWKGTVFSNTVFYKGKLYALNDDWSLSAVDPLFPDTTLKVVMKLKLASNSIQLLAYFTLVLVESRREMLMVRIMGDDGRRPTCDVFRADFIKMEWVTVENLGDTSLFLTRTSSVSICAGKNGNRIYYIPLDFDRIQAFKGITGLYVVFELGKDGLTISSVPDGHEFSIQGRRQRVSGWAWVAPTPSLA